MKRNLKLFLLLIIISLPLLLCNSNSSSDAINNDNNIPVIDTIPDQVASINSEFYLNLASYVHDDNEPSYSLSYHITSGSGTMEGPVYSNQFPVSLTEIIEFSVTDSQGGTATGSFTVNVQTSGMQPLDFPSDYVFVSGRGEDVAAAGTIGNPFKTISYAISRAKVDGKSAVVVPCGRKKIILDETCHLRNESSMI